ncbi:amidase signature enzyme [Suillus spraguei]|nr:amidase signature enzyme [Suillus spraguei]
MPLPDLYEASVIELQAGLTLGQFTSVDLIKAYFTRIEEVNLQGPMLRAVIETNPALHGIPVLVKDNIVTVAFEGMNTTAGSYSLLKSVVLDDAGVVKRLCKAGAIILGKANLSEWAHFRGNIASGWSGRGGQCTNAYYPNADPCGSSAGSAVSASIGLAAVTLGTETDRSITCPVNQNNVVGIKPTVGLTSCAGALVSTLAEPLRLVFEAEPLINFPADRLCLFTVAGDATPVRNIIPISEHQDTVGPLTHSVIDAAIVLSVIAGPDPNDNFMLAQPTPIPDYILALSNTLLVGKRIGVPCAVFLNDSMTSNDPYVNKVFEQALETLKVLGATVVDPAYLPSAYAIYKSNNETIVLDADFKIQLNAWFDSLIANPSGVASLEDLIMFDNNNPTLKEPMGYTDQSILIESQATTGFNASYYQSLAFDKELGATSGIDAAIEMYALDALVLPAPGYTTVSAAIAGYPIVTVPLGFYPENVTIGSARPETVYPAPGIPIGLSFLGTAWSEYSLVSFAYAYEQKTQTRLQRKAYAAAILTMQLADVIEN